MNYLVVGGSRGIGRYLSNKYANEGKKVFSTYQATEPTEIENVKYSKVDVCDYGSLETWISEIDPSQIILMNCAALNYNSMAHKSEPEQWKKIIETNLVGSYNAIRSVLPIMRKEKFGRIINFTSVVATLPTMGVSAYAASKSGLWGMSKSIGVENIGLGITINNLSLGYMNEGMTMTEVPEKYRNEIQEKIPAGEFGNPENIYNAIEMLIKLDYMTGADLDINGGLL